MTTPRTAPYGSWKSPITAAAIASGMIGLDQVALDGEDIYWIERRPAEEGRHVVVCRTPDGRLADVTPAPLNARTRVHEYGGGAYAVHQGTVYFSNFADQRLYRQDRVTGATGLWAAPRPITPELPLRYADGVMDARRGRLVCVREDHRPSDREAINTLVSVRVDGDPEGGRVLVSGNDFYASPRLSPGGDRMAWLSWNHPNMPWDGTELWVGEVAADGSLGRAERVAGGPSESIFQPAWSPDGILHFVSDRTGWWNLYRWRNGRSEPLCEMAAEFGAPQWVFGMSMYAFDGPGRLVCTYHAQGSTRLAELETATRTLRAIDVPYAAIASLHCGAGRAVFVAGSPEESPSIVVLDREPGGGTGVRPPKVLRRALDLSIDPGHFSRPEAIEFPTEHGLTAHGFFYPPQNRDVTGPPGERPPLIVRSHGGPTAAASSVLALDIQFWTSRGFGILDVNYGGSTGYGRPYRERLNGQWGVVDVDDCVNGARYLVAQGRVDGARLAIQGGSAGGYTTLCALTFRDVFKAGASYFGLSDLEIFVRETHKFESRYLERLVGPYPEQRDLYYARSPIHFLDRLSCPMILFQGLEDKIVPPNQSEMMFEAVRKKGFPVAYLAYEGEQHGFRRAENIKRTLEAELYFYSRVFGFPLAEPVDPVRIENLPIA
jgi:dipeptidyl aminopeptidase/acylaminoacyl peptidase